MKRQKHIKKLTLNPPTFDPDWQLQRNALIESIKANLSGFEHQYDARTQSITWTTSHVAEIGGHVAVIRTTRFWDCTRTDHVVQMRTLIDEQAAFAKVLRDLKGTND